MEKIERLTQIEYESLKNLKELIDFLNKNKVDFAIIGGYALGVYCPKKRFTKDIDMAILRTEMGSIISQLKDLGFIVDKFEHNDKILKASKIGESQNIELHISIDKVSDETTSNTYSCKELLNNKKIKKINPFFEECVKYQIEIPVIDCNDAIILKLMTNRDKDLIDCTFYLLLDQIDLVEIGKRIKKSSALLKYTINRLYSLFDIIKNSKNPINDLIEKTIITEFRFSTKDIRDLKKRIKNLIQTLKE